MQDSAHSTLQPRPSATHHHHNNRDGHGYGHHGPSKAHSLEHAQPPNTLNVLDDASSATDARHVQRTRTSKVPDTTATATALPTEPTASVYKNLTFYPAYCFPSSPTYHKWVNITASSIHQDLKPHNQFSQYTTSVGKPKRHVANDGLLLFYLNHPIQFVQVVGVIVAFDGDNKRFWIFTLDDASGSTIDVLCPKPDEDADPGPTTSVSKSPDPHSPSALLTALLPVLDLGTTVQVKGTLSSFRKTLQINLKRIFLVPSTAHELAHIRSRNDFFRSTLSIPWALSERRQRHLLRQANEEAVTRRDREKRRRKRQLAREQQEILDQQLIVRQWEEEEKTREKDALEANLSGNALQAKNDSSS
ncbi:hypothetical protein PV10_03741 [Exophiala mesophila]|uniref:CST complex subunit Stn1 N-terminal domain-containing protein n=1 Tax=Exophiala mesophila TaxID=212818 RepID=A0A0D1ZEY8_EXOME|nr:uncharacterized protein PV10_03741 [Exophiala mesophila]KIV92444.1 hypothetical protein PV10_03741 [Exophiala mesophila]